jgi:hypothetical protein
MSRTITETNPAASPTRDHTITDSILYIFFLLYHALFALSRRNALAFRPTDWFYLNIGRFTIIHGIAF